MKKLLGYILVLTPFVGFFIYATIVMSLKVAIACYALALAICVVIALGMKLLGSEDNDEKTPQKPFKRITETGEIQ